MYQFFRTGRDLQLREHYCLLRGVREEVLYRGGHCALLGKLVCAVSYLYWL